MSWKHEVQVQIAAVLARRPDEPIPVVETDAHRRELIRETLVTGAKLFRFARAELARVSVATTYEYGRGSLRLAVDGTAPPVFVEAETMMGGLAIKVQREYGVVEILQAKDGVIVDSKQECIGAVDAYFTCLVVELVATACGVVR